MVDKSELANAVVQRGLVTPQADSSDEKNNQIGIIKGLSTENDLIKIELRLRGYTYNYFQSKWTALRKPIMNNYGIGNFMASLQALGDLANFSNYSEEMIPKLVVLFFEDNYPTYILYAEEFELDPKDFNVINSILKMYALSVLLNAKNAGHRNVVRGTLSENLLNRALMQDSGGDKKRGWLSRVFRKDKEDSR